MRIPSLAVYNSCGGHEFILPVISEGDFCMIYKSSEYLQLNSAIHPQSRVLIFRNSIEHEGK